MRYKPPVMVDRDPFSSPHGRPSPYLRRACENCRRRKIKCDGVRPICHQCRLRPPRTLKSCRYTHTPPDPSAEGKHLGDQLLDSGGSDSDMDTDRVLLSNPYPRRNFPGLELDPLEAANKKLLFVGEPPMRPSPVKSTMEEPLPYATQNLIDAFLGRFFDDGFFFLDPREFRHSALLPVPFHHPARPSPGLLSAVYLWGTHILASCGRPPVHEYTIEDLLSLTVGNLTWDIHGSRALMHQREFYLQTMQSEVLLSLWYLDIGEPFLGRYHCVTATTLAAAHDNAFPDFRSSNVPESTETRRQLCAVYVLEKIWLAVSTLSTTPQGGEFEFQCLACVRQTNYPTALLIPSGSTIQIITEQPEAHDGQVPFTLLANAALLFERAVSLTDRSTHQCPKSFQFPGGPSSPNLHNTAEFHRLAQQIDAFQGFLRPSVGAERALPINQTLLVAHALTNMATIRLHASRLPVSVESAHRSFLAAGQIVNDLLVSDAPKLEPRRSDLGATSLRNLQLLHFAVSYWRYVADHRTRRNAFGPTFSFLEAVTDDLPVPLCSATILLHRGGDTNLLISYGPWGHETELIIESRAMPPHFAPLLERNRFGITF
ncbi:Transcriptional activator protein acu-15 [Mycena sanguinolenta]|uniref:Transcriptional activator protein acu-15 n=1 Tax=Mycena sanguinolenta TaxID=230812 RepID=A0A8H6Y0N0_9AGAR|nr:Transcriptional activator protein acu-15 [Mycena sanguinolenta]